MQTLLSEKYEKILFQVIFLILIVLELFLAYSNNVIFITDSFDTYTRAVNLSFKSLNFWSDGFYPFGYPLLLKILSTLTFDYLIAAKIVSLSASFGILWVVFQITKKLWGVYFGLISLLVLGTNSTFLTYSCTDNTDMLCLFLSLFGLYFIVKEENTCSDKSKETCRRFFTAGLIIGAAYLIRYTALVILLSSVIWLFIVNSERKVIVFYLLGFLIAALPQLLISYILHKDPFWNLQVQNIWFGIYGNMNWGANWAEASRHTSISSLFFSDPFKFIQHVHTNITKVLTDDIFKFSIYKLGFAGLFLSIIPKKTNKTHLLFLIVQIFYLIAISMAFVNERVLILVLPILVIYVFYPINFIYETIPVDIPKYRISYFILVCFGAVLFLFANFRDNTLDTIANKLNKKQKKIIQISNWVNFNNNKLTNDLNKKIISFSYEFYDNNAKAKTRFDTPWHMNSEAFTKIKNTENLVSYMKSKNYDFMLFDQTILYNIPSWQVFWSEENLSTYFSTVYKYEDVSILFLKKNQVANVSDFSNFLNSKPHHLINGASYPLPDQRIHFYRLFQDISNWEGNEWHRDNILPLWNEYKRKNNLL